MNNEIWICEYCGNVLADYDSPIYMYFRYHTHNLLYDIFFSDEVEVIKED